MKTSHAISLRLILACAFAWALSHLSMEAWIDARAQQHERHCKPPMQKTLHPDLRAAIEQLRAEQPQQFCEDHTFIDQHLLRHAGLPSTVEGFLCLLTESNRTCNARINFLIAMRREEYSNLGICIYVSEHKDYAVALFPQPEESPTSLDGVQFLEVYDNVSGTLRSADWFLLRGQEENARERE